MNSDIRDAVVGLLSGRPAYAADGSWDEDVAKAATDRLVAEGWSRVGLDEELGGSGGSYADAAEVLSATAYSGSPSPVADMVAITNPLASRLGVEVPADAGVVLPLDAHDPAGRSDVAWGSWASHLLVVRSDTDGTTSTAAVIPASGLPWGSGRDIAGRPKDSCSRDEPTSRILSASPVSVTGDASTLLHQLGALARSVQIAAALVRLQELTVAYTAARRQFGRSLDRMPVVRHELAGLAGEVAAAHAAARAAVEAVGSDLSTASSRVDLSVASRRAVAVAKVRTGAAATSAARVAHQLHGAIGITREYELHRHTTATWAWRDDFGPERDWATLLGQDLRGDDLWAGLAPVAPRVKARTAADQEEIA